MRARASLIIAALALALAVGVADARSYALPLNLQHSNIYRMTQSFAESLLAPYQNNHVSLFYKARWRETNSPPVHRSHLTDIRKYAENYQACKDIRVSGTPSLGPLAHLTRNRLVTLAPSTKYRGISL